MSQKSIIFSLENDFICNNRIWKRSCAPIVKGYKKSGNQCRERKITTKEKALQEWNNAIAEWSLGCIHWSC